VAAPPPAPRPPEPGALEGTYHLEPNDRPREHAQIPPSVPSPRVGASAYLYVIDGADKGRSWPLPHGAITIGRGPHNTIVLNDPGVSTAHAQVGFDGAAYMLVDLKSRNGCYVNNQKIDRSRLRDRDVIVIGTTQIAVAIQG